MSLQLKWGRDLDAYRVREVLLESASWKEGDSARTLAGRLDIRAAALLLKASPGTPGAACAPPGSRQGDWTAAGSTTCAYVVAPQRLADRYAGVSHHKFGTIDIKLPDGRAYNVPHLHYAIGDGQLGMRFLPVSDEAGVGRPDGASAPGSSLIDAFLRRETGLNPEDPIYALLSYIHPEEHTVDFFGLTSGYLLQLGHRHIGAYLGNGLTSHVLQRKTEWKGDGPLKMKWNVDRAPATVHVLSLHGVSQSVLNRNAHIVNGILAAYGRAPTNPKTLTCRTIDINTTLQFYRDTIRGADYLEDLSWFTNCAVHATIVVNTLVNVPHNESSFRLIFGDEGVDLWSEFRRRYEEVNGRAFLPRDETDFVPLWRLAGFTPEQIRPLSFLEYNRFQVAKLEGWLDEYPGRVPLAPGKGQAWPLESVVDLVSRFLEVYTNLRDAGGVNAAAALLCLRHGAESILGLSSDTYVEFVKPFVTALILAEAISEGGGDPAWLDAAGRQLEAIAVETDETPNPCRGPAASVVRAIRECVEDAVHWVANTSGQVDRFPPDAAAWFRDAIEPARDRLNALALSGRSVAGLFSTPSIIHQIERGLHPHSPFIKIRALCTAMDRSELVPNCSRHFTQGQLLAVRVPDLAGDTRDHGHLERQQRKDTRGMADAKVAVSLDAPARGAAVCSPQPGAPSIVPSSDAVTPAACECGSKRSDDPSRLAYVLGQVGYDFVSQSRLNSIRQRMGGPAGPEMRGPAGPEMRSGRSGGTEIAFEALRVEPVRGVGLSVVVDAGRDADLCHRTERPVRPGNVRPVAPVPP